MPRSRIAWVICTLLLLAACGGGGGSSRQSPPASTTPPPPVAPAPPSVQLLEQTARLTTQATFGVTWQELNDIARQGSVQWLDAQLREPATFSQPVIDDLVRRKEAGEFTGVARIRRYAWWHNAIRGKDQLRQRVAFALSEIFVVGDSIDAFMNDPYALGTYNDTLLTHAFGNYRDLLLAVTLHPAMGTYLSHVNNRKADSVANTFPDENYAREVMQLFSIGLFTLNADGTLHRNGSGQPIPTYDNTTIREYARYSPASPTPETMRRLAIRDRSSGLRCECSNRTMTPGPSSCSGANCRRVKPE